MAIDEIDVAPVQIQGPKSVDLMADLVGDAVRDIPYYGLMAAKVGGRDCIISQTGFTGEKDMKSISEMPLYMLTICGMLF